MSSAFDSLENVRVNIWAWILSNFDPDSQSSNGLLSIEIGISGTSLSILHEDVYVPRLHGGPSPNLIRGGSADFRQPSELTCEGSCVHTPRTPINLHRSRPIRVQAWRKSLLQTALSARKAPPSCTCIGLMAVVLSSTWTRISKDAVLVPVQPNCASAS